MTGLTHYLDSVWNPQNQDVIPAVKIIANATNLDKVAAVKPDHYRQLREVDGASFQKVMKRLNIQRPIRSRDEDKLKELNAWFFNLVNFFLIVRPSNKRAHYNQLTPDEQRRFCEAFTHDAGKLFHVHVTKLAEKHINSESAIDPNDLYDLMQLLLLRHANRIFVTDDRAFYDYQAEPEVQRFLPWTAFRSSSES